MKPLDDAEPTGDTEATNGAEVTDEAAGHLPAAKAAPLRARSGTPRVAMLVYNDAANDSRVRKTAASLRRAGCEVRIIAVAQEQAGHGPGSQRLPEGSELVRVEEFDLAHTMPWIARTYRRMMARVRRTAAPALYPHPGSAVAPEPQHRPGQEPSEDHGGQRHPDQQPLHLEKPGQAPKRPAPTARAGSSLLRTWLGLYRSVRLGAYWMRAAADGIAWAPDVVHANDGNTLYPAMRIAHHTGARIIYDAHELWRHRNAPGRTIAPLVEGVIERQAIRRAAGVITVSPNIAAWLQRTYRLPQRPTLVRNIPAAGPVPDPANGQLRRRAGLPTHARVIAYGGRLTTDRGIEETIDALAHLPAEVHLVLLGYGDEDYVQQVRRRAEHAGLAERVHLVGAVPSREVATALADADLAVVYVRPTCLSYTYSLPNKLFEAIHAGLPIAAASLPDTRAVISRYGVGEVFAPTATPRRMGAAITDVLDRREEYRHHSRQAAAELTWEHEEAELIGLYRRVLEGTTCPVQ